MFLDLDILHPNREFGVDDLIDLDLWTSLMTAIRKVFPNTSRTMRLMLCRNRPYGVVKKDLKTKQPVKLIKSGWHVVVWVEDGEEWGPLVVNHEIMDSICRLGVNILLGQKFGGVVDVERTMDSGPYRPKTGALRPPGCRSFQRCQGDTCKGKSPDPLCEACNGAGGIAVGGVYSFVAALEFGADPFAFTMPEVEDPLIFIGGHAPGTEPTPGWEIPEDIEDVSNLPSLLRPLVPRYTNLPRNPGSASKKRSSGVLSIGGKYKTEGEINRWDPHGKQVLDEIQRFLNTQFGEHYRSVEVIKARVGIETSIPYNITAWCQLSKSGLWCYNKGDYHTKASQWFEVTERCSYLRCFSVNTYSCGPCEKFRWPTAVNRHGPVGTPDHIISRIREFLNIPRENFMLEKPTIPTELFSGGGLMNFGKVKKAKTQ